MNPPLTRHVPVLLEEVLTWLAPSAGQIIVDGTLGGGGHTRALAERVAPDGYVIALDRDARALAAAESSLKGMCVKLVAANFREIPQVLKQLELPAVDAILLDLGLSSDQLADEARGFSFDAAGDLDLRFDNQEGEPAWRLLERIDEQELADLIYKLGEERYSRRIARKIVETRRQQPLRTARGLAALVRRCVPASREQRIDPATRTFQALRIAVNDELGSLQSILRDAPNCLKPNARMAVISFHSLEDRLVKEAFRDDPRLEPLTKKPIAAGESEVVANPRARSAKLRVARRVAT